MFAFALWDRSERTLHLVRDRLGIKPMYYGCVGTSFVFGLELKAIRAYPGFEAAIDRGALASFMRYGYVPDSLAIYEGIRKLPPGSSLRVSAADCKSLPEPTVYWSAAEVALAGLMDPFRGSEGEAVEELDAILAESVQARIIADVPLGAFLSGGIDSTTVVALMQAHSPEPVRTFTIGSADAAYDEAGYARRVADHLGTNHTELYVTPREAQEVIPLLPSVYDEPFADSSQIPTFLVSRLARSTVTVSLSGDGGDEVFGGYNRHAWGPRIRRQTGWIPAGARKALSGFLTSVSPDQWDSVFERLKPALPRRARVRLPGDKVHKAARALVIDDPWAFYRDITSQWADPASVVTGVDGEPADTGLSAVVPAFEGDLTRQIMLWDTIGYLPGDILTKLDRASMAVSLEARVPLLDHRVVEFAWRLPINLKVRRGRTKWILREVLDRYVPREIVDRPKAGFGIPVGEWLRGPLREWADDLLSADRLASEGYLRPEPIRVRWHEHLSREGQWDRQLWNVLMFQAWLEAE